LVLIRAVAAPCEQTNRRSSTTEMKLTENNGARFDDFKTDPG
jgi:hypothetical protein